MKPRLIQRRRDLGWLALSPAGSPLQIGVTAPTEREARSKLAESLLVWERTIGRCRPESSVIGYEWPPVITAAAK